MVRPSQAGFTPTAAPVSARGGIHPPRLSILFELPELWYIFRISFSFDYQEVHHGAV